MEDKELFNPQTGEKIAPKRPKKFYKDWRFYVYSLIALMLAIVSISSCVTACAAINAGVGQNEPASFSVAQRKNAAITTDNGNFTGYQFSIESRGDELYAFDEMGSNCIASVYTMDVSTYTPTLLAQDLEPQLISAGVSAVSTQISTLINTWMPSDSGVTRFLIVEGISRIGSSLIRQWQYFTLLISSAQYGQALDCFVLTNWVLYQGYKLNSTYSVWQGAGSNPLLITAETAQFWGYTSSTYADNFSYIFQDVKSYYKELGYQDGYSSGYSSGYDAGYSSGYDAGYSSGYDAGYSNGSYYGYNDGYSDGYADGSAYGYGVGYDAGLAASSTFTSLRLNNKTWYKSDLTVTDSTDTSNTYALLRFVDQSSVTWYVNAIFSALDDSFVINLYSGGTASNNLYATMFSGTMVYLNDAWQVDVVWNDTYSFTYAQMEAVFSDSINMGYFYINWDYAGTTSYKNGYAAGYSVGRSAGINEAEPEALTNTLVAVFQQPFNQIYRFFNFNILGLNILGLATGLLSVFIIIKVFKKVLK